jgi:hypothetical protein
VLRADPVKSSENTLFQPGRSPTGMATPDGPAGTVGGGGVFGGGVGVGWGLGVPLGVGVALAAGEGVALSVAVGLPVELGATSGEWRGVGRSTGWRPTPESSTTPPTKTMIRARMAAIFQPRGRGALGMHPFDQVRLG